MIPPQRIDSGIDNDGSLLKSWGSISVRSDHPLTGLKTKQFVPQPSRFGEEAAKYKKRIQEKGAKANAYIVKPVVTSGHRMDSHDAFITEHTERVATHTDFPLKQLPMPYSQFSKDKRIFHTPFKWTFNPSLAQHVNTHSLYTILEVQPSDGAIKPEEKVYQIQPNEEKIDRLQEQIEIAFKLFYRLTLFHRMKIDFSVQANKLKAYLKEASSKIEIERDYEYDAQGENLFVHDVIEEKLYQSHEVQLRPIIIDKMIPILAKLKKEFYAMEYLSGEHVRLEEDLRLLLQDVNRTIVTVETVRKNAEKESKLSSMGLREAIKLEKLRTPQDLYNSFIQSAIQIGNLHSEANRFSKFRTYFKAYLKGVLISEVYSSEENKIREMKKKLTMMKVQIEKRIDALVEDGCIRRSRSVMTDSDLCVQEFNINFKSLIEGNECLDEAMFNEMKDHIKRAENFIKLAQVFCEEIKLKKNQNKVLQMSNDTSIYLKQIETVIQGIELVKETMKKVGPVIEDEYNEDMPENIEKKMLEEFSDLTFEIKQSSRLLEDESWTSTKVKDSLDKALDCELESEKAKKGEKKSIPVGKAKILSKLAKIIRKRQNEKNKLYITCKKRVDTQIKVEDVMEFLKSKKLWQAIASHKSSFVSIQGVLDTGKKTVNNKVYCNPELETCIMKIIKAFVIFLVQVKNEVPKPEFIWY